MKHKNSIKSIFKLIDVYTKMDDELWETYKEPVYEKRYRKWNDIHWENLRQIAFELITGEPDFEKFYNRFDSSAFDSKNRKPVAWDTKLSSSSYIPDYISDTIFNKDLAVNKRVKEIKTQYNRCVKLEKEFKKKND